MIGDFLLIEELKKYRRPPRAMLNLSQRISWENTVLFNRIFYVLADQFGAVTPKSYKKYMESCRFIDKYRAHFDRIATQNGVTGILLNWNIKRDVDLW